MNLVKLKGKILDAFVQSRIGCCFWCNLSSPVGESIVWCHAGKDLIKHLTLSLMGGDPQNDSHCLDRHWPSLSAASDWLWQLGRMG